MAYLGLNEREGFHWGMIRGGMSSVALLFVAQMQDYLGLGAESRMNTPNTLGCNWQWRMQQGDCTPALAEKMRFYTELSLRFPELSNVRFKARSVGKIERSRAMHCSRQRPPPKSPMRSVERP